MLPPGPRHRVLATGLELDRRRQEGTGDQRRRRHRVAVGSSGGRVLARAGPSRQAAGRSGGVMQILGRLSRPAPGAPVAVLQGVPRLPWLWAAAGGIVLVASMILGVLVGPV